MFNFGIVGAGRQWAKLRCGCVMDRTIRGGGGRREWCRDHFERWRQWWMGRAA